MSRPTHSQGAQGGLGWATVRRTLSRQELLFVIGIPLAWAVLLLFHPGGEADAVYERHSRPGDDLDGGPRRDDALHSADGRGGLRPAARSGKHCGAGQPIAVVVFAIFYGTYESLQGIGNGVLGEQVNDLPASERGTGSELIQDYAENIFVRDFGLLSSIGALGLFVGLLATGIALRREAGAPTSVLVLLGFAGILIGAHPPPFGPIGLVLFVAAVLLYVRSQPAMLRSASQALPSSTTSQGWAKQWGCEAGAA